MEPPRTGIDTPLVWPPPELPHVDPPYAESLLEPESAERRAAAIAELQAVEAERLTNPNASLNRVVFDLPLPSTGALLNSRAERIELAPPPPSIALSSLPPRYSPQGPNDATIVFESRFECGNLRRAVQVAPYEYDLLLRTDTNTSSHTRWFFFSVANTPGPLERVKFNIVNMAVDGSLFNAGLRPLVWSRKAHEANSASSGWRRTARRIYYYANGQRRRRQALHTLTFSVNFEHVDDVCYFAFGYPYSYTMLRSYLLALEADPVRSKRFKRRTLCRSLAGNDVDVLTVTTFGSSAVDALANRRGVVLTARVHPGEVGSSWLMHGMLDFLTGPSLEAKILRDNFVFKVVPMLNPDGVVVGNHRSSLAGVDLNRQWREPSRLLHPSIYSAKELVRSLAAERDVVLFADLHGHSKKANVFMYGSEPSANGSHGSNGGGLDGGAGLGLGGLGGWAGIAEPSDRRLLARVLPYVLWRSSHGAFSYRDSSFKVKRAKESTGRVVVNRELGVPLSYTLEATYAGPSAGPLAGAHFSCLQLQQMGHLFCIAMLECCCPLVQAEAVRELRALHAGKAGSPAVPAAAAGGVDSMDDTSSSDDDEGRKRPDEGARKPPAVRRASSERPAARGGGGGELAGGGGARGRLRGR